MQPVSKQQICKHTSTTIVTVGNCGLYSAVESGYKEVNWGNRVKPSVRGYNWATLFLGDKSTGT
jgi:hypothetical protein